MRSAIVTEPIAEFDEAASCRTLDPRVAAAWKEYRKIRPILEALDGALRAGDSAAEKLLSDRLDLVIAAAFRFRRAEMRRMVDEVKAARR